MSYCQHLDSRERWGERMVPLGTSSLSMHLHVQILSYLNRSPSWQKRLLDSHQPSRLCSLFRQGPWADLSSSSSAVKWDSNVPQCRRCLSVTRTEELTVAPVPHRSGGHCRGPYQVSLQSFIMDVTEHGSNGPQVVSKIDLCSVGLGVWTMGLIPSSAS